MPFPVEVQTAHTNSLLRQRQILQRKLTRIDRKITLTKEELRRLVEQMAAPTQTQAA
jgi:hypothetical protein